MAKRSPHCNDDTSLIALGSAIRTIRKKQGISQEELALLAGIDRSYMGGIERGEHNIALINIKKLSSALKINISELMAIAEL